MIGNKATSFFWLLNDNDLITAPLKYDIRRQEFYLLNHIFKKPKKLLKIQQALICCQQLIDNYQKLLVILNQNYSMPIPTPIASEENDIIQCCDKIRTIKNYFSQVLSKKSKVITINKLLFYYNNLFSLIKTAQLQSMLVVKPPTHIFLKNLLRSTTCEEWLSTIVMFLDETDKQMSSHHLQLAQLSNEHILSIYSPFKNNKYIGLINNLFFYKLNPHCLYKKKLHPEKLISVQTRLKLLHSSIESLHQSILISLKQRGFFIGYDYLLHGEEIPAGAVVTSTNDIDLSIINAIRKCCLKKSTIDYKLSIKAQIGELFLVYKYWFKPILLLDIIMALFEQLIGGRPCEGQMPLFSLLMIKSYSHFSTNACLDLYGYFSNKDSIYLMRTLYAVANSIVIFDAYSINPNQKIGLQQIYNACDCVMNALRCELQNRNVATTSYARDDDKNNIKIKDCNVLAVKRALELYCDNLPKENTVLEQLFERFN